MEKLNSFIILLMIMGAVVFYPRLPEMVPIHWNLKGEVDSFMPKNLAVLLMPALAIILFIGFRIIPRLDPNEGKYKLFKKEWEIIQGGFIAFIAYLEFIIFYVSFNPQAKIISLMFIGLGLLFLLIGSSLSKIRQNYFLGIRVPWTLSSEENWNKTHWFASRCFVAAGIMILAAAYFIWCAPIVIFGGIVLVLLLPIVYSFLLFKKSLDKMKYIYAILIIVATVLFFIRLISGEDDWICKNGEWVRHGVPLAPKPTIECK